MKNIQRPSNIQYLETLQIFGLQANYMEQFQKYLKEEGIDTGRRVELNLEIKLQDDFEDKGLLVIKPKIRDDFKGVEQLVLEVNKDILPRIDLTSTVQEQASQDRVEDQAVAADSVEKSFIPDKLIALLNIDRIYREAWYYRTQKGYDNLSFTSTEISKILHGDHYDLYCDDNLLKVNSFEEIKRIEQVALIIVRKYIDTYYKQKQQEWEYTQLESSFSVPEIPIFQE